VPNGRGSVNAAARIRGATFIHNDFKEAAMPRSMTAQEMHDYLTREFENARKGACKSCAVPRTFWGPAAGPGASGYWYMELPIKCPNGCRDVLTKVWAQLTTEYDIAPPPRPVIPSRLAAGR
jgi:hypothetical protein